MFQWHEAARHAGPRGRSQLRDWQLFPAGRVTVVHAEPLGMEFLDELAFPWQVFA